MGFGAGVAIGVIICFSFGELRIIFVPLAFWIKLFRSISDSSSNSEAMSAHVFFGSFVRPIS